jgi:hypothetical protein
MERSATETTARRANVDAVEQSRRQLESTEDDHSAVTNSLSLLALYSDRNQTSTPGRAADKTQTAENLKAGAPKPSVEAAAAPDQAEATLIAHRDKHRRHKPDDAKADLKKELPDEKNLKEGDIIFRSSSAFEEARAIQLVSKSPLTHCGVLIKEGKDWYVYEAVQPVQKTLLKDFHKTDDGETYVVRRLKDADKILTDKNLEKMKSYLKDNVGKDYDHKFGWGDDRLYCSELVWKAFYHASRVKVGNIQMVGDFDLSDPLVKKHVDARYGKNVPVTEPTITPGGVYESRLLKTIK